VSRFAEDGSHLTKGGAFAEMEVMKMLFALPAAEAGTITLLKPANVFVEAGEQIAKLELDDPSLVARAVPFNEPLGGPLAAAAPLLESPRAEIAASPAGDLEPPPEMREDNIAVHQQVAYLIARAHHMLGGFVDNEDDVLNKLSELLLDQRVMWSEYDELMAGPGSKLPEKPRQALSQLLTPARRAAADGGNGFGDTVLATLAAFSDTLDEAAATAFKNASEPVAAFGEKYKSGMLDMSTFTLTAILEHFLEVEQVYPDDRSEIVGVKHLNESLSDPAAVLQAILSHQQLDRKAPPLVTPAAPRLHLGCASAARRLTPSGSPLAAPRLHLGSHRRAHTPAAPRPGVADPQRARLPRQLHVHELQGLRAAPPPLAALLLEAHPRAAQGEADHRQLPRQHRRAEQGARAARPQEDGGQQHGAAGRARHGPRRSPLPSRCEEARFTPPPVNRSTGSPLSSSCASPSCSR